VGLPVQVLAATPQQQAFWSDPFNWQAGAQFISEVRRADGQLAPVEMRVRALDGEVLLVSMLDRREQALHEAEFESLLGELRATLESAADAILVCDPDGRIRAFNHRFATLWGIPEALLVRRNDAAILDHLAGQVRDAESYAQQLKLLSAQPLMEASDVLDLRDGRILERRAVPQLRRGLPMGRIFSFRDEFGQWDPKNQRPELWDLYNTRVHPGENMRVFPISNWTELDVWQYIAREQLELPPIYFAHERQVIPRNGLLVPLTDLTPPREGETVETQVVRFRTVGDISCTCPVSSDAATVEQIIAETAVTQITERGATRMDDQTSEASMEKRKKAGYF